MHRDPSRFFRPPSTAFAVFAALMFATPASSQRPVPTTDLAGEWTGALVLDGGTQNLALVFRAADSTLSGTVYSNGEKFDDMTSLSLAGNVVHFKMQQLDFTGTIDGPTMSVALIMFNGSTRHLTLKKTPPPVRPKPPASVGPPVARSAWVRSPL